MNPSRLSNNFDFERWAKEFKTRATRDLYAGRSWKRLVDLGFTDKLISLGFFLACDFPNSPGHQKLAEVDDESRRKRVLAKRLISRLESDRNDLCDLFGIDRDRQPLKEQQSTPERQTIESLTWPDDKAEFDPAVLIEHQCDPSEIQASREPDTDFEFYFQLARDSKDEIDAADVVYAKNLRTVDSLDAAIARLRLVVSQSIKLPGASKRKWHILRSFERGNSGSPSLRYRSRNHIHTMCRVLFSVHGSNILGRVPRNPKHLGADIGFLGVLHTWGQNLVQNPHS